MNNYEASDNRLSFPHKTIFEQENCDPGLALTEHNGDLYLAWADGDKVLKVAHHLEKVSNGHLVDKVDLGEKSKGNPALASFNGHLYLAWADQNGTLNMMYGDGQTFYHINMPPERSAHGPDLTVYNGNLYIAWTSDKLHGPIPTSALHCARVLMEGDEITGLTAIPIGSGLETSPQAPALASFNGRLYLAWVEHYGLSAMSKAGNEAFNHHKFISQETCGPGLALTVCNGNLYIAWAGLDNHKLNVAVVPTRGDEVNEFENKATLPETSRRRPALASWNERLYLAWAGTDGKLNLLR